MVMDGFRTNIAMLPSATSAPSASVDFRELLEGVYRERDLFTYEHGQRIVIQPQDIWVVCRGIVKLTTLYPSGDEAILGLVCPSMPFGLPLHPGPALRSRGAVRGGADAVASNGD